MLDRTPLLLRQDVTSQPRSIRPIRNRQIVISNIAREEDVELVEREFIRGRWGRRIPLRLG